MAQTVANLKNNLSLIVVYKWTVRLIRKLLVLQLNSCNSQLKAVYKID